MLNSSGVVFIYCSFVLLLSVFAPASQFTIGHLSPPSLPQISDVEQILGLMHVEPVGVQAEAYDVAMDVSFPRGEPWAG